MKFKVLLRSLLASLLLIGSIFYSNYSWAEISKNFSIGLSQTNNLELQSNIDNPSENDESVKRQGLISRLSLLKQSLELFF